jgi:glycosyltransferase involved in cell wall biosynthesis
MTTWHVLTGEYPPQPGGVSDYTRLVARGLAASGDEVIVWRPPCPGTTPLDPGVAVLRLPDHFGPRSLAALQRGLARQGRESRLLLQYVPHAFGYKAMNLPLCLWLALPRRPALWVIFHEVAYPLERGRPWEHRLLAHVTRLMAALLVRAARRIFVTIPAWEGVLRSLAPLRDGACWLPVPSNIPLEAAPEKVAAVRTRLTAGGQTRELIGHFGTFGGLIAELLGHTLPRLLDGRPGRLALLVGRDSARFARSLEERHPRVRGRLVATGALPVEEIAPHLAACDLLVQPYPDGASSRRTSLAAGLALGVPTVTTTGALSEPFWESSGAVGLARAGDHAGVVAAAEALLADPQARRRMGDRSARLYRECFSLERTITTLRRKEAAS